MYVAYVAFCPPPSPPALVLCSNLLSCAAYVVNKYLSMTPTATYSRASTAIQACMHSRGLKPRFFFPRVTNCQKPAQLFKAWLSLSLSHSPARSRSLQLLESPRKYFCFLFKIETSVLFSSTSRQGLFS